MVYFVIINLIRYPTSYIQTNRVSNYVYCHGTTSFPGLLAFFNIGKAASLPGNEVGHETHINQWKLVLRGHPTPLREVDTSKEDTSKILWKKKKEKRKTEIFYQDEIRI